MSIYLPDTENLNVKAFITANVVAPTGNINDDFRTALIVDLGLPADTSLSIEDLWKLYLLAKYPEFNGNHVLNYVTDESSFTLD
jgi:hypothetical protein